MHYTEVIKSPIMTEKTNLLSANNNEYVFKVDIKTNKIEIKKAIEFIYKVKVARVNIIRLEKQPTSLGRSKGWTDRYKKAIVKLVEGDSIVFIPEEDKTNSKDKKDATKDKLDKQSKQDTAKKLKDVEAKIAAKKEKSKKPKIKVEDEKPKAPEATLMIKDQPSETQKRVRKVTKKNAEEIIAEAEEKQKTEKAKTTRKPRTKKEEVSSENVEVKPKRTRTKKEETPSELGEDKPKTTRKPRAKKEETTSESGEEKPKRTRAKKQTKLQAQLESAGAGEDMLELAEILESARKKIKTVENKIVKEAITKSINETGEIPVKKTRKSKKDKEAEENK
ncbi:50S ribosomal protein L23 [Mycoplasma elephantis]|uniref:50S ribosomal protein L23 n=1 Tax=Mycoplasma elephantis TaxID=114882 RepID=UPI00068E048B|nr:50S ribosomal protein L23 [Mycoplasma elephantis]